MAEYKQPKTVATPEVVERLSANDVNMSVGSISRNPLPSTKTSGIKIRGTGAATKGTMARGPMA
jgi:hypothetical protein